MVPRECMAKFILLYYKELTRQTGFAGLLAKSTIFASATAIKTAARLFKNCRQLCLAHTSGFWKE
jgi:hypothetical protein